MFSKLFSKKQAVVAAPASMKIKPKIAPERIGDLGEYKINIQLDQLPKDCKTHSDVMLLNTKSKSGYSQIDHIIISPYTIFVIETKNYAGTIYGDIKRPKWSVNGKFPMMNPLHQNYGHIKAIHNLMPKIDMSQFVSMVSFTKRSTFKVNEDLRKIQSNELIVYDTELTEFITRKLNVLKMTMKSAAFSEEQINEMHLLLSSKNVVDPHLRANHVKQIKSSATIEESKVQQITKAVCHTCGNEVSEKVSKYCSGNKVRFKGNIYCFEHQKLM